MRMDDELGLNMTTYYMIEGVAHGYFFNLKESSVINFQFHYKITYNFMGIFANSNLLYCQFLISGASFASCTDL